MLKRPPQHRVDAPIVYIHPSDSAWQTDRVAAEQAAMKARGEEPKMHPVARYQGGWTRYDLDAQFTLEGKVVTARDYLDEAQQPTMWRLHRLNVAQWYEIHPLWEKAASNGEQPYAAFVRAAMIGVEKVENGPTLELPGGRLSPTDMQTLHEIGQASGVDLVFDLGKAVYTASMPLSESEGKR